MWTFVTHLLLLQMATYGNPEWSESDELLSVLYLLLYSYHSIPILSFILSLKFMDIQRDEPLSFFSAKLSNSQFLKPSPT